MSWTEVLIGLTMLIVFLGWFLPMIPRAFGHGPAVPMLSNMRQLQIATQQMAEDGIAQEDRAVGWPGDTGGTFTNWAGALVPGYLSTNGFCKLLSAPGKIVPPGKVPESMRESALLVYAVRSNSAATTVFLTSANFTNTVSGGTPLQKKARPLGNTAFLVLRKGGDGAILSRKQTGQTNLIGTCAPLLR